MQRPAAVETFAAIVDEAFAQWGRAAVLEAGLFMRPWDFEPGQIAREVRLWHGSRDKRIPAAVAEAFAGRLAGARRVAWPDHGHFSWAMSNDVEAVVAFVAEGV